MGKGGHRTTFRCKINNFWGCNVQHGVCAQLLGYVRLFETSWTIAHQASMSMEFSRQEYWSGLSFPTPGDLPNPGIELCLLHRLHWQLDSLLPCHLGSPVSIVNNIIYLRENKGINLKCFYCDNNFTISAYIMKPLCSTP